MTGSQTDGQITDRQFLCSSLVLQTVFFLLHLAVCSLTFPGYAQIDSVNEGFWQTVCVKILLRVPEGTLQLTSSLGKTLAAFSHAVKPGSVLKYRPWVLKCSLCLFLSLIPQFIYTLFEVWCQTGCIAMFPISVSESFRMETTFLWL